MAVETRRYSVPGSIDAFLLRSFTAFVQYTNGGGIAMVSGESIEV